MRRICPVAIRFIEFKHSHILSHFLNHNLGDYGLNTRALRDVQVVLDRSHTRVDRCRRLLGR
jgi:hypothetical protein